MIYGNWLKSNADSCKMLYVFVHFCIFVFAYFCICVFVYLCICVFVDWKAMWPPVKLSVCDQTFPQSFKCFSMHFHTSTREKLPLKKKPFHWKSSNTKKQLWLFPLQISLSCVFHQKTEKMQNWGNRCQLVAKGNQLLCWGNNLGHRNTSQGRQRHDFYRNLELLVFFILF